jgi:ankyrin repeat protein
MVDGGFHVNTRNIDGMSIFDCACSSGEMDVINYILDKGLYYCKSLDTYIILSYISHI